jgi:hypothetical protein
MSQEMVYKLKASHLVVNTNTTICSGFNNDCSENFPALLVNISYFDEITKKIKAFQTNVFILPKSPIDVIIGRNTIKQQQFTRTTPSPFKHQKKLSIVLK